MAPPKRPWFRIYTEALQDRKLRRLPPAQRWVWIAVLSLSCQSPRRGRLLLAEGEPATIDDVADEAAVPKAQARQAMAAFERLGMVATDEDAWIVPKWDKRQWESDNSTERVQRHRNGQRNNDETLHREGMERSASRAPTTESESESEAEGGSTRAGQGEREGEQRSDTSRGKPRSDRATRIPDGWTPAAEEQLQTEAQAADVDLHRELERFRDYWQAQGGQRGRRVDWQATWRNWLRKAIDDKPQRNGRPPPANSKGADYAERYEAAAAQARSEGR